MSGRISRNGKDFSPISKTTIQGDKVSFSFNQEDNKLNLTFEGKVTGHTLEGTVKEGGVAIGTWKGTRNPVTLSKIF
jgi:hypothetical protein